MEAYMRPPSPEDAANVYMGPIAVEDMPLAPTSSEAGVRDWAPAINQAVRYHLWRLVLNNNDPRRFGRTSQHGVVTIGRYPIDYICYSPIDCFGVQMEGIRPAVTLLFFKSDGIRVHAAGRNDVANSGTYVHNEDPFSRFGGDCGFKNLRLVGVPGQSYRGFTIRRPYTWNMSKSRTSVWKASICLAMYDGRARGCTDIRRTATTQSCET